jgi:hypothetical protein
MESNSVSLKHQGPFFGDGGHPSWAVIRNRNRIHNCGSQAQFKEPDLIDNISIFLESFFWENLKISQKSNRRSMTRTITGETKREGQRKAKRRIARGTKKRRKLVHLMLKNYVTHGLFNVVTCKS